MKFRSWANEARPRMPIKRRGAQSFRCDSALSLRPPLSPLASVLPYLANVGAEFFALENYVTLTEHGTFQPTKLPGEIFSRFTPQPKEPVPEDVARKAYRVLEKLDANRPPTPFTVWRLYGKQEMSAQEVAKQCHCSKATVVRRLKFIRTKTGLKPQDLRTLSPHFSKIEADISDSRASHIYRKGFAHGYEVSDESEKY